MLTTVVRYNDNNNNDGDTIDGDYYEDEQFGLNCSREGRALSPFYHD